MTFCRCLTSGVVRLSRPFVGGADTGGFRGIVPPGGITRRPRSSLEDRGRRRLVALPQAQREIPRPFVGGADIGGSGGSSPQGIQGIREAERSSANMGGRGGI